jgi:hypothetical protein
MIKHKDQAWPDLGMDLRDKEQAVKGIHYILAAFMMMGGCSFNQETSSSIDSMASQTLDQVGGFFSCFGGGGHDEKKEPVKHQVSPSAVW